MSRSANRNAVKAAIVNAGTAIGSRVYIGRRDPVPEKNLPCAVLLQGPVGIEYLSAPRAGCTRYIVQTITLEVIIRAAAGETWDDEADTLIDAIDEALTDHTLSGAVKDLQITSIDYQANSEGNAVQGAATLTIELHYTDTAPTPEA